MFNKILIANRGEIACRIIKTTRSMGIHAVCIYSAADRESLHVQLADSAYYVGEAPAKDSYLNISKIIQIAKESGAQAIHPGYGFLSENPEFAKACEEADLIFIGPSIEAINAMASKQTAKQLLEKTKVPLTPGYHGEEQSEERLLAEAKKMGFPVLIKAALGGGGKGMRSVFKEQEFSAALAGAKREALASFADDNMIIEKLILKPRHIELQIMADNFGSVVHLFERDCSIQRRHQKIIEEAPAPNLSPALRQNLAQAACEVARAIHYRGAGTIEFLVDESEHFYFMEMNTRLQVEHPVTERITGLDLVAWQLKIAANEPLPLTQDYIKAQGHAIECRVYAEDPFHEFIPSVGRIHCLQQPQFPNIRIDTGVRLDSEITKYYDPMIAKLISWGEDREEALKRLEQALEHYYIGGVKTNIPFLQAICQNPKFRKAQLNTAFLEEEKLQIKAPDLNCALLMAVSFDYLNTINHIKDPLFKETFAWQMQGKSHWTWRYLNQDEIIEALVTPLGQDQLKITLHSKEYLIHARLNEATLWIETASQTHQAFVDNKETSISFYTSQGQITLERFHWNQLSAPASSHQKQLTAPMPATVVAVLKKIGDTVKSGEHLMILEAMKMEHTIHAPFDGILSEIFYPVGAQVDEGAELLFLGKVNE